MDFFEELLDFINMLFDAVMSVAYFFENWRFNLWFLGGVGTAILT